MPSSNSVCVADGQQAQFQSWYYRTYKEQQKQCGLPDVPIDFEKKTKIFQNAPVKSWPWMVRFEKIFNLISTRYQNLKNDLVYKLFSSSSWFLWFITYFSKWDVKGIRISVMLLEKNGKMWFIIPILTIKLSSQCYNSFKPYCYPTPSNSSKMWHL